MKVRIGVLASAVLIMWALKRFYADTPVDALRWMLDPVAALTTIVTGVAFDWRPGEGYFSIQRLFLIEKACAGINFMIAVFGMTAFVLSSHARSWRAAAAVLAAGLLGSYAAAVILNTLRIAIALWLGVHARGTRWMSGAEMHRLEGIACYFGGLVVLYEALRRFERPHAAGSPT